MDKLKKIEFKSIQNDFVIQYPGAKHHAQENFDKEVSFCMQHVLTNPYILECDRYTIMRSVLNVAQTGLTLNPVSKEAYLVPRRNYKSKSLECCLDPSYIGLIKLATETGAVKHIEAQVIYEGDEIELDLASEKVVKKHIPYILTGKPKGEIIGSYSLATLADGAIHSEIMGRDDIDKIRDRSEGYKAFKDGKVKSAPWFDFAEEMARKTVIKRHFKYLPKNEILDRAIHVSNEAQATRLPITNNQVEFISRLIQSSTFDETKKQELEGQIFDIEFSDEASEKIEFLLSNQINQVQQGSITSQGQINNELDAKLEDKKQ